MGTVARRAGRPLLRSAEQLPWIARLETELDNVRVAIDRALSAGAEEEAGALCLAMGWFWWLRNYRHEGADWADRTLRLGAALDALGADPSSEPGLASREMAELPALAAGIDPVDAFLAHADGEEGHPRHAQRMNLRMLHVFLLSEAGDESMTREPRRQVFAGLLRARFERGGPDAARMPGLVWPITFFQHGGNTDLARTEVLGILDQAVANCRTHGGEWELACALMFRTHMVVDSPGGLLGVDEDLAELRDLARRVGDRWVRAQVSSAVGEAAMARGRSAEAESEYREALRLAYEVGAYTETPFLLARLAEIAYRAGDGRAARTALDEASESADRYGVADARAFVLLLRAHIALDEEDTARARELCTEVRRVCGEGTPPPQFLVALDLIDAQVTAAESGPVRGLPILARTLRQAVADHCSEAVTSAVVDIAAELLAGAGDLARAARLSAAADRLLGAHPRPSPEGARAERTVRAAREGLGERAYAAERTRGAALTPADTLRLLEEAAERHTSDARVRSS